METKRGAKGVLRVFLKAGTDVTDALLPIGEGGRKLDRRFGELVAEKFGGSVLVELFHEPAPPIAELHAQLRDLLDGLRPGEEPTNILKIEPDIVVLSIKEEIRNAMHASSSKAALEDFLSHMLAVIKLLKERIHAHVIIFNASTADVGVTISNYHGLLEEPKSLLIHRLNLTLMELSVDEGISIVDVDRLVGELGTKLHVLGTLDYSPAACRMIQGEFLRVVEDYGFFEDRPLIAQVGRKNSNDS